MGTGGEEKPLKHTEAQRGGNHSLQKPALLCLPPPGPPVIFSDEEQDSFPTNFSDFFDKGHSSSLWKAEERKGGGREGRREMERERERERDLLVQF